MALNVAAPQYRGRNRTVDGSGDLVITTDQAFTAGRVPIVDVQIRHDNSTTPSAPSVAGGGGEWEVEKAFVWDAAGTQRSGFWRFRCAPGSPSGTTITITPAGAFGAIQAICYELVDVATGNNGADAFG